MKIALEIGSPDFASGDEQSEALLEGLRSESLSFVHEEYLAEFNVDFSVGIECVVADIESDDIATCEYLAAMLTSAIALASAGSIDRDPTKAAYSFAVRRDEG